MFGRNNKNQSQGEAAGVQGAVAPTAQLLPMQELSGNMLVMKDQSYRLVLKVGAVNMDLKGIDEQYTIISAFQNLLAMLKEDWPLQIVLHSSFMDPEQYVAEYRQRLKDPTLTPQMRAVISDHVAHFIEQAESNHLLERSYYVVVSWYDPTRAPTGESVATGLPGGGILAKMLDGSASERDSEISSKDKERARVQLVNRAQAIRSQLSGLGIDSKILSDFEVMALLRRMYNPGAARRDFRGSVNRSAVIQTRRPDEERVRARQALPPGNPNDYGQGR